MAEGTRAPRHAQCMLLVASNTHMHTHAHTRTHAHTHTGTWTHILTCTRICACRPTVGSRETPARTPGSASSAVQTRTHSLRRTGNVRQVRKRADCATNGVPLRRGTQPTTLRATADSRLAATLGYRRVPHATTPAAASLVCTYEATTYVASCLDVSHRQASLHLPHHASHHFLPHTDPSALTALLALPSFARFSSHHVPH